MQELLHNNAMVNAINGVVLFGILFVVYLILRTVLSIKVSQFEVRDFCSYLMLGVSVLFFISSFLSMYLFMFNIVLPAGADPHVPYYWWIPVLSFVFGSVSMLIAYLIKHG